ncbi:hypothetical protein CE91St3_05470 [Parabacteroides merdae]|uniref:Uncharacterized protein n=1 Tax=Parabacteroides merdae TaxID=46503 RepID=A0AA37NX88_9BACT|nr:hypothetical protein CE91St3_05470 [Parabacteroides merdae]
MLTKEQLLFLHSQGLSKEDTFDALGMTQSTYYPIMKKANKLTYIIHSGFISGYQNRYGDNLKPPTNVYHRMTA